MKNLTSEELLVRTKNLVTEERRATLSLIEHLEEIQARRLYVQLGYTSLWDFATRYLGLSEGAAQRRIQAMRLIRDVPEAKASLADGKLSLTNAAKLQSFRQTERKQGRKPDAHQLVQDVQNLSQRECELKLLEISPQALPEERERIVSATEDRELKIVVDAKLYGKLQRLRELLSYSMPEASYAELLDYMTDEMLKKLEKKKGISLDPKAALTAAAAAEKSKPLPVGKRIKLPVSITRAIWARGHGQCEVRNTKTGKRCNSRYRIDIDHVIQLAHGGTNDLSNLRLACWHCNQQRALARSKHRKTHPSAKNSATNPGSG